MRAIRHFYRIAFNLPVVPLMAEIVRHPELWNALAEPPTIPLRGGAPEFADAAAMRALFPIKKFALDAMQTLGGSVLGSLAVQKLEPGKRTALKSIKDDPFTQYRLVLNGQPGSLFLCGDETVTMQSGELWWFDHNAAHAQNNNSEDDDVQVLLAIRHD